MSIAIRRRLCHAVRPDRAGGTRDVLDHHRRSPRLGEFLAEQARDGVSRTTTGRETDHEANRFFRVSGLRSGMARQHGANVTSAALRLPAWGEPRCA